MTDWHNYESEDEIIDLFPDSIELDFKGGKKSIPLKVDGKLFVAHLPVVVPLSYCKNKEYNAAEEILSAMGLGLRINDAVIKPPSLGVFSLMEITNNPFPVDFSKTTAIQQFHALYFNEYREESALMVRDWLADDGPEFDPDDESTYTALDAAAIEYINRLGEQGVDLTSVEHWIKILDFFSTASNGFEMVPGSGSSKYWFGAETFGAMAIGVGQELNLTPNQIMWETPLTTIGFSYVAKARANGTKGVARPKDRADIRRQRILAYLREIHGELHPWQIDRPKDHILTPIQKEHKACVKKFEDLKKGVK